MASLFLTTKCNLCCEYCYNREIRAQITEQTIPFEIAKAGIDFFFSENSSRHIRFYGPGEPTQEIELMKQIVDYARSLAGNQLIVELQTNGVFDKKDREWLLENINIMWVSFDGEPDVHDAQRHFPDGSPTSSHIENNIRWLVTHKKDQNFMIGARVTITNENVKRQIHMVDYFYALGIFYIWSDPLFPKVGDIPTCADITKMDTSNFDMNTYVHTYIAAFQYAKTKDVFYGSFLTCNFDGKTDKHCRACTPVPHFTPDGYISACDLVTLGENAHHMDCFVYGKWNPITKGFEILEEKLTALRQRTTENMEHCRQCLAKEYCGGYCLGEVVNETGSLFGQKPHACKAIRLLLSILEPSKTPYPYMHP
jgi:radical SAM protein with 4Fe4S-binding SPASM domain